MSYALFPLGFVGYFWFSNYFLVGMGESIEESTDVAWQASPLCLFCCIWLRENSQMFEREIRVW